MSISTSAAPYAASTSNESHGLESPQRKCQASNFPALPWPVWFFPAADGDGGAPLVGATGEPLQQATLRTSGTGQPVFLEGSSLRALTEWASGPLPGDDDDSAKGKLLFLAGPPVSGTSTALSLLPGLLAARCSLEDGRRKPVFLKTSLSLYEGSSPRESARTLIKAASALARRLGFDVRTVDHLDDPLYYCAPVDYWEELPGVLDDLARGIYEAGGELILLLSEVDGPLLACGGAPNDEAARDYLRALERTCAALRGTARIVIAGGETFALLRALQTLPEEGAQHSSATTSGSTDTAVGADPSAIASRPKLRLWDSMTLVQLGATPPPASARAVAAELLRHRADAHPVDGSGGIAGQASTRLLEAERLLAWLALEPSGARNADAGFGRPAEAWAAKAAEAGKSGAASPSPSPSPQLTAPRPALVSSLVDRIWYCIQVGDAANVSCVFNGRRGLQSEVWRSSTLRDAALAAQSLSQHQRALLHAIATGKGTLSSAASVEGDAKAHKAEEEELLSLLAPFCQPATQGAALQLLPPYDTLFGGVLLNGRGEHLLLWESDCYGRGRWSLHARLHDRLSFFSALHARAQARLLAREEDSAELRASKAISKAVLEVFAAGGVGVPVEGPSSSAPERLVYRAPATIAELASLPASRAVFEALDLSLAGKFPLPGENHKVLEHSLRRLERCLGERLLMDGPAGGRKPRLPSKQDLVEASPSVMGLQLLAWLYRVRPDFYINDAQVIVAGLRATLVDVAAEAAVDTWRDLGFPVSPDGVPCLPLPPAAKGAAPAK